MIEIQIAANVFMDKIPKDKSLEDRVKFAFNYVKTHPDIFWMSGCVNDDLKFRTALAAIMLSGNDEDRDMIARSMKPIQALSALMSGIPIDFAAIETKNTLPLMGMYRGEI